MEEQKMINTSSVRLSKSVYEVYSWEIRVSNDNLKDVVKELKEIDDLMKINFPKIIKGSKKTNKDLNKKEESKKE